MIQESPLDFLREYELRNDLPEGFIAGLVGNYAARPDGAWQRLERGELLLDEFCRIFDSEVASLGYSVSTAAMMLEMADYVVIRPRMIEAVRRVRAHGMKAAALTNNWNHGGEGTMNAKRSGVTSTRSSSPAAPGFASPIHASTS